MITNVKLQNWRSHLNSNIEFSSGTNVLTGVLGAGKSSILDAISFGLFGTFPNLQSKKLKLDDIIMSKPALKNKTTIGITFVVDNKEYSVVRVIERGKGTTYSEIREGDKLLDAPNSQRVTEIVQKLLKIDYELFSKAIYSEQNGLDYFLRLSRGERMKKIDNLLRIDRFEKARGSTVTLKNKLIERKLAKQNLVDQVDLKELESTISDIEKAINQSQKIKSEFSKEYEIILKDVSKLQAKINKLEDLENELNKSIQQKKSIEATIKENKEIIENINKLLKGKKPKEIEVKLEELKKELEEKENEFEKKIEEQEKLTKTLSELRTKMNYLEKEKTELIEQIEEKQEMKNELNKIKAEYGDNPDEELINKRKELEKLNSEITTLRVRLKELDNIITQVNQLKDRCPICDSKISEDKKKHLIEERETKMKEIRKDINTKEIIKNETLTEIDSLEKIVDKFNELIRETKDLSKFEKELKNINESYSGFMESAEKVEKNLLKIKEKVAEIQDSIKNLRSEIKNYELIFSRISELKERGSKLKNLKIELEKIQEKILEVDEKLEKEKLEEIRKKYENSLEKRSELKTKIDSIDEILNERINRKKELEEKLESIKKQKEEIVKLDDLIKNLGIFENALEKTQIQLREEFVDTVNHTMNDIWPDLYPYLDFVSICLSIEEGDYVLQLKDKTGRWLDVEGIASGGERSIACLALRIAFSLVLAPQLKWLILDEPTHNLDTKAVEDLAETLKTRVGEFVEQVFLITHDKTLENAVTGELYRLFRDKERDGVTKIERATEI